eukprot:Opistho-2@68853
MRRTASMVCRAKAVRAVAFFGSFFGRKRAGNDAQQHNVEKPPAVLRPEGSMSEREIVEIEVVKLLMRSYFGIVKKTVQDMVPKSTMLFSCLACCRAASEPPRARTVPRGNVCPSHAGKRSDY